VIFIIRTYAFTGHNKFILAFLVVYWIGLFITIQWIYGTVYERIDDLHVLFGDTSCIASEKEPVSNDGFHSKSQSSTGIWNIFQFLFDSLMTMIVFIHCVRHRIWSPLGKAFVFQTLLAYVLLTVLNIFSFTQYLSANRRWDAASCFYEQLNPVIACWLILSLKRNANPSATTEARENSRIVRDAVARLETTEDSATDDAVSEHYEPIERWE